MTLKWLPNALTIARCILAIVVGYTILDFDTRTQAGDATALILFLPFALFSFVALTDWLDGWLARKLDAESAFGARLDPIGDKLLSASSLLALSITGTWAWFILIPTLAIVSLHGPLRRCLPRAWADEERFVGRWIVSPACVSLAAQLGTGPLIAWHFQQRPCSSSGSGLQVV